jgi:hypothetical protein
VAWDSGFASSAQAGVTDRAGSINTPELIPNKALVANTQLKLFFAGREEAGGLRPRAWPAREPRPRGKARILFVISATKVFKA